MTIIVAARTELSPYHYHYIIIMQNDTKHLAQ